MWSKFFFQKRVSFFNRISKNYRQIYLVFVKGFLQGLITETTKVNNNHHTLPKIYIAALRVLFTNSKNIIITHSEKGGDVVIMDFTNVIS